MAFGKAIVAAILVQIFVLLRLARASLTRCPIALAR
jgi:hypothetical protein